MSSVEIIGKAVRVIKSCQTYEQIEVARKFCGLAVRRYGDLQDVRITRDLSFRGEVIASLRAFDFKKELNDLITNQYFVINAGDIK
jgi:hypothetical protein